MKFAFCFAVKLVDVEGDGEKDCFGKDVGSAAAGEAFETVVLL